MTSASDASLVPADPRARLTEYDATGHAKRASGGLGHNTSFTLLRSPAMPPVEPGKKAPAFSLSDQDGKVHRLADYAGRPVVLYFYPKDDTPGCTKEACAFRDNLPKFAANKAAVLGVSILDTSSKAKFAEKYNLNFPLLADVDHAVAEKYGVWQKRSLYGRSFMGIVRTTFLIDSGGKIRQRWDNVKVDGHAEAVQAAVDEL
jgi:thioredoxin-dependent peroxiredoxin